MNLKKNIYPCLIYVFTIIILFSTVVIPEMLTHKTEFTIG